MKNINLDEMESVIGGDVFHCVAFAAGIGGMIFGAITANPFAVIGGTAAMLANAGGCEQG